MTQPSLVRPAAYADLEAVAEIFGHYVRETVSTFEEVPPTSGYFEDQLDDLTGRALPFLVAVSGPSVVGFAYAAPWRTRPAYRHTVEDTIYLAPTATGRGIGSQLLRALIESSRQAGARQMIAVVTDSLSTPSARLHHRLGFVEAGRLIGVGYKHGRWIDTFLLQRALGNAGVG